MTVSEKAAQQQTPRVSSGERVWNEARWVSLSVCPVLLAAVVFVLARDELSDDALISLSYGRTLGLHGWWGMQPGVAANSQTSPLNALVLGGITALVRSVIIAAGLVWCGSVSMVTVFVDRLAARLGGSWWAGPAAGSLVACSPLMVATIGLETALVMGLVTGLAWAVVMRGPATVGALCGLLALARPDAVVFGLLAVVLVGRSWWRAAGVAAAVAAPWLVWSWWALGSAVPDTLLLKAGGVWPEPVGYGDHIVMFTMANGPLLYVMQHPSAALLTAAAVTLGLTGLVVLARTPGPGGRAAVLLGGGAAGYYTTMLALDPGPYVWYFGPSVMAVALAGMLGLAGVRGGGVLAGGLVAMTACLTLTSTPTVPESGNFASSAQYSAVASHLPSGPITVPGEIGALTFYCDGRCITVGNAFSERAAVVGAIRAKVDAMPGLVGMLARANFARLAMPPQIPAPVRLVNTADVDQPGALAWWPISTVWRGPMRMVLLPAT
ncbi:hypothetical protein QFW96_03390 [Saccharopolyspora sp. TS4A08]|uniref:Glycosyltransferase RgtA/B/C/D-like domain-containing protein n=1 Tax=Saccharopolyspora ipomoeae TaxID=3042027 RepID=A0ABT6PI03_9PSEU|nr:hypothetical protein [Saccharopolyspora sp. TS4A08]MDI2027636.1 hypothetical protein [Saccharopolyspora sp. TS4A08]